MSRISYVNTRPFLKRHTGYPYDHSDYISNLPDGVLGHILSCLPVRDAVRTCVLSKDWKFKWTLIYNVNIHIGEHSLECILEKVLVRLQKVKKVSVLCLCPREKEFYLTTTLVPDILRHKIKDLELRIYNNRDFFIPRAILDCFSLRKVLLYFKAPCTFQVPVKNCFPNLKSLCLSGVKIRTENPDADTLIISFPLLKVLELRECKWVKLKSVEINAPSLSTFISTTPYKSNGKDFDYSIKVFGATLAKLETNGGYPENIIMIGSTVAYAKLECNFYHLLLSPGECGLQVRRQLSEFSDVKYLSVNYVLQAVEQTRLGISFPRLHQLKRLYLYPPFDVDGLLELLHAAPYLKFLWILMDCQYYDFDSVDKVPSCIVHHLEEVTFHYTEWIEPNFLVERFLLKNGAQLESIVISSRRKLTDTGIAEKLSMFPKASPHLKIIGR